MAKMSNIQYKLKSFHLRGCDTHCVVSVLQVRNITNFTLSKTCVDPLI